MNLGFESETYVRKYNDGVSEIQRYFKIEKLKKIKSCSSNHFPILKINFKINILE